MSGAHPPNGTAIIDGRTFKTPGALATAILTSDLPMPCVLRVGKSLFSITAETQHAVALGLLIAAELQAANEPAGE